MSHDEIKKYDISKKFRKGCAYCISGGGCDRTQSEHWIAGWEWASMNLRSKLNEGTNDYIVKLGFKPFATIEALR